MKMLSKWEMHLTEIEDFCRSYNVFLDVKSGHASNGKTIFNLDIDADTFTDLMILRMNNRVEAELRAKNPALCEIYDKYLVMLALIKETT